MSFKAGSVFIELKGRTDDFSHKFQRAIDKIGGIPQVTARAATAMAALGARFREAARNAEHFSAMASGLTTVGMGMAAVGVGAGVAAKAVTDVAKTTESNLAFAGAIAGKTEAEFSGAFDTMRDATIKYAAATKFNTGQVSESFINLTMSGMDATTAVAAMPAVLQLAAAANMDLAQSAGIVVGVMAGYGKKTSDLKDVNNALVATFTGSNTSLSELGEAFKYVGPMATTAGVALEDTSAALGLLANANLKASMGGTGLRRVIGEILAPTRQSKKALDQLGISTQLLKEKGLRGVVEQAEKVRNKLIASGNGAKFAELAFIAFGDRGAPALNALAIQGVSAMDKLRGAISQGQDTDIAAFVESKQLDTFQGSWLLLTSALESFALSVGQSVLPVFRGIVEGVRSVVDGFNSLNPNLQKAIGIVFTFGTIGAVAVGVLGAIAAAAGMATPGLITLFGVIKGGNLALATMATRLGAVAVALGVFTVAYAATRKVMEAFGDDSKLNTDFFTVIKTAVDDATASFKGFLTVVNNLVHTVISLLAMISGVTLIPGIGDKVKGLIDDHRARMQGLIDRMQDTEPAKRAAGGAPTGPHAAAAGAETGETGLGTVGDELEKLRKQFVDTLRGIVRDATNAAELTMHDDFSKPFVEIRQNATDALDDVEHKFSAVMTEHEKETLKYALKEKQIAATTKALWDGVESGTISNIETLERAISLAGLKASDLGETFDDLSMALHRVQQASPTSKSDIFDRFHARGEFAGSDAKRGAGGVEGQLFDLIAGGKSAGSADAFMQAHLGSQAGAALLGGQGIRGLGQTIGMAAGGPLGAAVADAILGVVEEWAATVGDTIAGTLKTLFADQRLQGAVQGAGEGAAAVFAATGLTGAIGFALGPLMAFGAAVLAVTTVLTLGTLPVLLAIAGAIVLATAAVLAWPLVMGGIVGAFVSLATQTKSYQRMQGALTVVIDKVVRALEPFFANALALVGLVEVLGQVFLSFVSSLINNETIFRALFEVGKVVGLVLGGLALIAAATYDAFVYLGAVIVGVAALMKGGDFEEAFNAFVDEWDVELASVTAALDALKNLTYEQALAAGEAAAAEWDLKEAADGLAGGILNDPTGLRVERYRFDAQSPSANGGEGAMREREVILEGDVNIIVNGEDAEDTAYQVIEQIKDWLGKQSGNPHMNPLPSPMPRRRRRWGPAGPRKG